MTVTSIRPIAVVATALAAVTMAAAPSHAAAPTRIEAPRAVPASYVPGTRPDVGGAPQLLLADLYDEHITITTLGVHLGGDGWSGGTLLR